EAANQSVSDGEGNGLSFWPVRGHCPAFPGLPAKSFSYKWKNKGGMLSWMPLPVLRSVIEKFSLFHPLKQVKNIK
ncbi:MAG TPA: hypothetical protein VGB37_01990, partial [Candidatus Lokiarchaeia archaeon]